MPTTEIISTFKPHHLRDCHFPVITVYDHPTDFPHHFVARLWDLQTPTPYAILRDSLQEIREALPAGLHCLQRQAGDDPHIVEVWI